MDKDLYLAAGCFWGAEHFFKQIDGVLFTEVGFANGHTDNPTYEQVYTDTTGFAETVHLRFDPLRVSLNFLLQMYFKAIDPTSLNQQGEDRGTRYRTGIYYTDPDDLPFIRQVMDREAERYSKPLQVEVEPLINFFRAEDYHQDYLVTNPNGYCHLPVTLFAEARAVRDLCCAGRTGARPLPRACGLHAHRLRQGCLRVGLERTPHPHGAGRGAVPRPYSL